MLFSRQLLGIDLGSYTIKVARIVKKRGGYHLTRFGTIAIPVNTIVDGSIMNTYEMNDAIKTLLTREHIKDRYGAISISGHGVINRMISMPEVSDDEFHTVLQVEAEAHVPHDISEIYFDGIRTNMMDQNKKKVVLVAARRDLIGDFTQVVVDSGVKPMSVEIDASALANIFEINHPEELDKTVAILNIGASKINVVVVSKGAISFFRDIPSGGNYITEQITRQLKISFEQAERLKSGQEVASDSILPNQVEEVVASVAGSIVADVQRVFDYYLNTNPDDEIEKVFITGGTTRSHTFTSTLESQMDLPVERLNPFKELVISPQVMSGEEVAENASIAAVCLGLALRRYDEV